MMNQVPTKQGGFDEQSPYKNKAGLRIKPLHKMNQARTLI